MVNYNVPIFYSFLEDCAQEDVLLPGADDSKAQSASEHITHQRDSRYVPLIIR